MQPVQLCRCYDLLDEGTKEESSRRKGPFVRASPIAEHREESDCHEENGNIDGQGILSFANGRYASIFPVANNYTPRSAEDSECQFLQAISIRRSERALKCHARNNLLPIDVVRFAIPRDKMWLCEGAVNGADFHRTLLKKSIILVAPCFVYKFTLVSWPSEE